MKLEIELTEKQEKFLKMFAEKHCNGAEDNRMTSDCLHVVEDKRERHIVYHEDLVDYYSDLDLKFCNDEAHECWYDNEVELIEEYLLDNGCDEVEVVSYEEAYLNNIIGLDGEEYGINSYNDYFKSYGIQYVAISWIDYEYIPVAYFFILDEAKRYLKYQAHNLRSPRVYTHSAGYSNCGDFIPFRDLLLEMGTGLIKTQ